MNSPVTGSHPRNRMLVEKCQKNSSGGQGFTRVNLLVMSTSLFGGKDMERLIKTLLIMFYWIFLSGIVCKTIGTRAPRGAIELSDHAKFYGVAQTPEVNKYRPL